MSATAELEPRTFGHGDHVCWLFDDALELHRAAVRFLGDGAGRGEQLLYLADAEDDDGLLAHLAELEDVEELLSSGRLLVSTVQSIHRPHGRLDVDAQVQRYRELTEAALAAGRTGFRVAADATALVRDPDDRQAFLAYELAVDRYIAGAPMAAMCAYDTGALGQGATALSCVHRDRHVSPGGTDAGFALYAIGDRLAVEGELDLSNRRSFEAALVAATEAAADGDVVLDVAGLTFADVAAVRMLVSLQERLAPRRLVVDDPSRVVRRVAEPLGWVL